MIILLELIAKVANMICISLFFLQIKAIAIIDFFLDHNKGLEEKLYRRTFDRAHERAERAKGANVCD